MKTSFNIGNDLEVGVYWSSFGLEVYSVNGQTVYRKRHFSIRGTRNFVVTDGDRKRHVEIKIDLAPRRMSWIIPGDWVAQAYVDGELAVADLFPKVRRGVRLADKFTNLLLIAVVISSAVVWIGSSRNSSNKGYSATMHHLVTNAGMDYQFFKANHDKLSHPVFVIGRYSEEDQTYKLNLDPNGGLSIAGSKLNEPKLYFSENGELKPVTISRAGVWLPLFDDSVPTVEELEAMLHEAIQQHRDN